MEEGLRGWSETKEDGWNGLNKFEEEGCKRSVTKNIFCDLCQQTC